MMGGLLCLIGAIGLWDASMQTLSLMIVAVVISVAIGIPIGILMASFHRLRTVMLPVLDVMQTMPSFVYLIPVVMLFNLGKIAALFATVIRSEEHTSELQSLIRNSYAVFFLKKKTPQHNSTT